MNIFIMLAAATVSFVECEKCDKRMRVSADGERATINVCRLRDDRPDAATLEARKAALKTRAEKLMAVAASAREPGKVARPLMGWSSWNSFRVNISEDIILEVAKAMKEKKLDEYGYRYVNIDDGFFGGRDENGKLKIHPTRFPNGLKPVVDGIHDLGFKAGIYSEAGSNTCGSKWDNDAAGVGSGLYGHDQQDCDFFFKELGFDFIKVDYCGGLWQELDEEERYRAIRKAIDNTGRKDVRMNVCRWTFPGEWAAEVGESWRTTADITADWSSVKRIIDENIPLGCYIRPGHYNDMDMLEVGRYVGKIKSVNLEREKGLTPEEEKTHFGMWCFMSSPLLIGCDIRTIPEETVKLITNPFLLAMNQNDLGAQPKTILRQGEAYILAKDADELRGPSRYVVLYNGGEKEEELDVRFFAMDLAGKVQIFDLMERADCGEFTGGFKEKLAPHSARFLRLDAERRR